MRLGDVQQAINQLFLAIPLLSARYLCATYDRVPSELVPLRRILLMDDCRLKRRKYEIPDNLHCRRRSLRDCAVVCRHKALTFTADP